VTWNGRACCPTTQATWSKEPLVSGAWIRNGPYVLSEPVVGGFITSIASSHWLREPIF